MTGSLPPLKLQLSDWMPAMLGVSLLLTAAPAFAEPPATIAPTTTQTSEQTFSSPASASGAAEISRSSSPVATYPPAESMVVLRLQDRRVYLYSGTMLVSSYPVAVGTDKTPTPQGEFLVGNMVVNPVWQSPWTNEVHEPGPDSALGVRWIGFADSEAGAFGFHGTPTLDSIGTAASNGCVRMRNEDVTALFAAVAIGTPVIVEP